MLTKPLWPIVDYISNYDYIVTELCQNRARPELNCDGKCYLAQMLTESSRDQENNPFATGKNIESPLFLSPFSVAKPTEKAPIYRQKKAKSIGLLEYTPNLLSLK